MTDRLALALNENDSRSLALAAGLRRLAMATSGAEQTSVDRPMERDESFLDRASRNGKNEEHPRSSRRLMRHGITKKSIANHTGCMV
jgi:hypothetical protein